MSRNRVIGVNNQLPWHLPEDLKHFRALTMGHAIVMGRKTYESIGRLLPGRKSLIVSRNTDYAVNGAHVVRSLTDAFTLCENESEVFVIGGAELYRTALDYSQRIYMTEINLDVEGDAYFPPIDASDWKEISRTSHRNEQGIEYSFVTLEKQAVALPVGQ